MRFDIVSLFPESLKSYSEASILGRAQADGKIEIYFHQLRDWAVDKHKTTDDTPYGGGAGMVMKVEPFHRCLQELKTGEMESRYPRTRVILLSAKGKRFTQSDAQSLLGYDRLIFLCGRYEGVDERVAIHLADDELSIGDFVLTGGELPAMMVVDAVSRLLPGVLGNALSAVTESFSDGVSREHPQYTKPEIYNDWEVPPILLSGNHAAIEAWRQKHAIKNK